MRSQEKFNNDLEAYETAIGILDGLESSAMEVSETGEVHNIQRNAGHEAGALATAITKARRAMRYRTANRNIKAELEAQERPDEPQAPHGNEHLEAPRDRGPDKPGVDY